MPLHFCSMVSLDADPGRNHCSGSIPSLWRAQNLSQTRARAAEKAASLVSEKNQQMAALLLEESLRLSAHRQWVKLLEVQISMLRKKEELRGTNDDEAVTAAKTLCLALALCPGIAGVGFVFGRYIL